MLRKRFLRSYHMWSKKRLLKEEKKKRSRKFYLLSVISSGLIGIVLMVVGILLIMNEPLFTSPLPMLMSWGSENVKEDVQKSIEKILKEKSIEYTVVKKESADRYSIQLQDNGLVFINPEKGVTGQLSSLQVVLQRLTMEGKKFKRLDLTYDRPVIVLQ